MAKLQASLRALNEKRLTNKRDSILQSVQKFRPEISHGTGYRFLLSYIDALSSWFAPDSYPICWRKLKHI
jgi:hypothetical protein